MQSRDRGDRLEPTTEFRPQPIQQNLPPGAVNPPHTTDMACQMSPRDERGQRLLRKGCRMRIRVPFGLAKRAVRPRRRNGKAQAERRKQTLGESPDIENRLGTIQSLQRVQRAAAKAE